VPGKISGKSGKGAIVEPTSKGTLVDLRFAVVGLRSFFFAVGGDVQRFVEVAGGIGQQPIPNCARQLELE